MTVDLLGGDDVLFVEPLPNYSGAVLLKGGIDGFDVLAADAPEPLSITNTNLFFGSVGFAINEFETAALTGTSVNTTGFSGTTLAAPGQGTFVAHGPTPITGESVDLPNRPVSGAVEVVAPHPSNPNIAYIGTVSGGVWKTSNALDGTNGEDDDGDGVIDGLGEVRWEPVTAELPSSSISALVFDPNDMTHETLWAGTGSVTSAGNFSQTVAGRLLKTDNGGADWSVITDAAIGGTKIHAVVPTTVTTPTGRVVLAGTEIKELVDDGKNIEGGLVRSVDGGDSFQKISGNSLDGRGNDDDAESTGIPAGTITDLEGDPGNDMRFYAAMPGDWTLPRLLFRRRAIDPDDNTIEIKEHGIPFAITAGPYRLELINDRGKRVAPLDVEQQLYFLESVSADTVRLHELDESEPNGFNPDPVDLTEDTRRKLRGRFGFVRVLEFKPTDVDTGNNRITLRHHGLTGIQGPFRAETQNMLPSGLKTDAVYYIRALTSNTVELRTSLTSAPVTLAPQGTGAGTGTGTLKPIGGLFRTNDAGATWTAASAGIASDVIVEADRVELAVSAAVDTETGNHPVFVGFIDGDADAGEAVTGVFRSADLGVTWRKMSLPGDADSGLIQSGVRHFSLATDRFDPHIVYAGGDNQPLENDPNATGAESPNGRIFRGDARVGHLTGNPTLTFNNNPGRDTIVRPVSQSWAADGFAVGAKIKIEGSTNGNNGTFTIHAIPDANPEIIEVDEALNAESGAGFKIANTTLIDQVGGQWVSVTHNRAQSTAPHADSRGLGFDALGDLYQGDDGGVYKLVNPVAFVHPITPGAPAVISGAPELTFTDNDPDPDTIERSEGDWAADGFVLNQRIHVAGSRFNDGAFTIAAIADDVLTLAPNDGLVDEDHDENFRVGVVGVATLTGNPDLTFSDNGTADTITRSNSGGGDPGSWVADGFRKGQRINLLGALEKIHFATNSSTLMSDVNSPGELAERCCLVAGQSELKSTRCRSYRQYGATDVQ